MKFPFFKLMLSIVFLVISTGCHNVMSSQPSVDKSLYNPKAAAFNVELGLAYLKQNNPERAKGKLLSALQQDPLSPTTYGAMAHYLETTGNPEGAEQYHQKALKIAPGKGQALNNYGGFLCRQGQYAKAQTYFKAAVSDPDYVNVAQAYENAAMCAIKSNDIVLAEGFYKRALQHDNERLSSLLGLASLYFSEHKPTESAEYLLRYRTMTQQPEDSAIALGQNLINTLGFDEKSQALKSKLNREFNNNTLARMRSSHE